MAENAEKLVVDASVCLKWQFEDEPDSGPASVLLDDICERRIAALAPALLTFEILNALYAAVRKKRVLPEDAVLASRYLLAIPVQCVDVRSYAQKIVEFAIQYERSCYDSAYVVLADVLTVPFYTGDQKLFNALRERVPHVKWIGDYASSLGSPKT